MTIAIQYQPLVTVIGYTFSHCWQAGRGYLAAISFGFDRDEEMSGPFLDPLNPHRLARRRGDVPKCRPALLTALRY